MTDSTPYQTSHRSSSRTPARPSTETGRTGRTGRMARATRPTGAPSPSEKAGQVVDSAGATETAHEYLGTWVTEDRWVRHHLLPGGRYDEARGRREHAYTGSYRITGVHIEYVDDTGFSADGDFVRDEEGQPVLLHAGMVMRREPQPTTRFRSKG